MALTMTLWAFVGKVMSLHFNARFRFVIAILSRSKFLLISWHTVTIQIDFGAQENEI